MSEMKLYCGLDISKGRAEAALMDHQGIRLGRSKQFVDTPEGRKELCTWVYHQAVRRGLSEVEFGLEPTGGYEVHFQRDLSDLHWEEIQTRVRQLPTTAVGGQNKTTGQRTRTDSTSAWALAEVLKGHPDLQIPILTADQRAFRSWVRRIEKQMVQAQQTQTELQQVLYEVMPFMVPYVEKDPPQWVLTLLSQYGSAQAMAQARRLPNIPRAPQRKLKQLFGLARQQAARLPQHELQKELLQDLVSQFQQLRQRIEQKQNQLIQWVQQTEDWKKIEHWLSLSNLGTYTAIVVYSELFLGDKHYTEAEQIVKSAGLDVDLFQSGDKGILRLSKRGPKAVRRVLYLAALRQVKTPGVFRDYYDRLVQRKGEKHKVWALVAVMKKLLRVMWKLWNEEKDFDPQHETLWKANHPVVQSQAPQPDPAVQNLCTLPSQQRQQAPLSSAMRRKIHKELKRRQNSEDLSPENNPQTSFEKKEKKTTGRKKALPLKRRSPSPPPLPSVKQSSNQNIPISRREVKGPKESKKMMDL